MDIINTEKTTTNPDATVYLPWTDREFHRNPFPWYDVVREAAPVYQDPLEPGTYVITNHEDVVQFGKHPSLTMKAPKWVPKSPWSIFKDSVIVTDPPVQTELRRRSNKWFTPKMALKWAEESALAVEQQLNELGPSGHIEAFRNLALIPAHKAMCAAIGLPDDGYDTAHVWMHDTMVGLGSVVTEEEKQRCQTAFDYLADRVNYYIALRRQQPNNGMISSWIEDVAAGEMTEQQLFEGVLLFWATGTPNAAYLITGGLEIFARYPEVFERWKSMPEDRHGIMEEIARMNTPEVSFTRYTTEPLTIRDTTIPPESFVRFMISSANRDPKVFTNPHKFDDKRNTNGHAHLTFGIGAHACPGMIISKAEANAIFNLLADKVERIELAGEPIMSTTDRTAAYQRLPLKLIMNK